nr:protein FD isoform X3 [Ziziphus jujuba var. spinosa]
MLSSTGGEKTHHSKTNKCLSPTLFSSLRPTPQRTMEEVWKDINLCSLPETGPAIRLYNTSNGNPNHPSSSSDFRNMILQDFLARPFANNNNNNKPPPPPPTTTVDVSTATTNETTLYTALPPPATALSLNSGPDHFHFLDNSGHPALATSDSCNLHANSNNSNVSSFSCPFEALAASSPSFGKKRFPELESGSGDRRHKRMIKNRESAARSRARKQAYTNELELEVAHLLEENARLKRQQEQSSVLSSSDCSTSQKENATANVNGSILRNLR